ncbi:metallophosphoesterase [Spirosoma areae]
MKNRVYAIGIVLFFFGLKAEAQAPALTRGPYLQVITPTSVVIRWRTDQPTTGRVWFGTSASQLTGNLRESQPTLDHSLTLTGLQPATRYAYAVGYNDTQLATGPDYYVKTALPTGDTRPFRMWVLGDFGYPNNWQQTAYQAYRNAITTRPADLWVWLGDNAYCCGADDQYQQYVFDVYGSTFRNTPIFICPGNHDYSESNTNFDIPYYNLFNFPQQAEAGGVPSGSKSYFSANYGNVHLISLDSQGQEGGQYRLYDTTGTQVQWLKRDLAANRQPWTIVIFHHPPYSKGSHNSDTETQMRLLRENLTPILERYGVDIVFNGHSHGYERYYRLKGQTGLASTFDKAKHVVENTTARYDGSPNSCPILTKGKGTVYIVDGAGGAPGGQQADYPHPALVYGNLTNGGSLLVDVTDNRLDAQYLLGDGTIPDRFTIMKNVNKTASLTTEFADTLQLSASWVGNYQWTGGQTTRAFRYVADKAGTFPLTVSDNQQCLADQFTIMVQQPPKLTTKITTVSSVCVGSTIPVTAISENTTKAAGWQYDVLLSDASGNFSPERIVGSGTVTMLKATIPANLAPGAGYRLRVRPRGIPYAQLVASDGFAVKPLPTATLSGSTTVLQGQPVSLTINFTGDGPWKGSLSDGTAFSASSTPTVLTVQSNKSIVYSVADVENSCGKGTGSGQAAITVLLPTGEEEFAGGRLRIYPNPAQQVVYVDLTTTQKKEITLTLHDPNGRAVFQKSFGLMMSLSETIPLPHATGIYLLTVQAGQTKLTRKIVRQ